MSDETRALATIVRHQDAVRLNPSGHVVVRWAE